jgi:chromosomal replication initiator protein
MEIVSAVRQSLVGRVGKERFELWFERDVRLGLVDGALRVATARPMRLEHLRLTFRTDILAAIEAAAPGGGIKLEFAVDPTATTLPPGPATLHNANGHAAAEISNGSPAAKPGSDDAAVNRLANGQARQPKRQFARLADFLPGEANLVAFTSAQTAATRPGTFTPLSFIGPPGCGKTHLLEGIWRTARDSRPAQRTMYLSAEQFTNQFLEALHDKATPSFRQKVRGVELLLIDDVQFFAGKQSTIVELVHTIDALLRDGRQLVFSADRPPDEIRGLGAELIARLKGGLVCPIQPADFATRLGILQQMAARQHLRVPHDVFTWMAGQFGGDVRQLAGAVNLLKASGEAHARPIDLEFAEQTLDGLIHASRRQVRLPDILNAVQDVFGLDTGDLQSTSKALGVTGPRMLAMFLARKWTRAALSEISRSLGRKSHSTVVSAQHKVTEWLADGKSVPLAHGQCRVEDAIKRIESHLRLA